MKVVLRGLSAREQLAVDRGWQELLPALLLEGLPLEDAQALAYNAAYLFRAAKLSPPAKEPGELLERLSIGQIARLCEQCAEARGDLEELSVTHRRREGKA